MKVKIFGLILMVLLQGCTYYLGNTRVRKYNKEEIEWANSVSRTLPAKLPYTDHPLTYHWADQDMGDWYTRGKTHVPRVMIARLALGQDVDSINRYLQSIVPWGVPGTSSKFNPKGDYDFSEIPLCVLLYTFQDDTTKLYPETAQHIVETLLVHAGGKSKKMAPKTLIIKETENHIFMAETSRYLKNQWLWNHGNTDPNYNNKVNGLEAWWLEHLQTKIETGMFEFNSAPYSGYSLTSLMTLEAFAESDTIKKKVRELLDLTAWKYALGSLDLRRFPPMRRRLGRAHKTGLQDGPQTSLMITWLTKYTGNPVSEELSKEGRHHMLLALILPYQPSDTILSWVVRKPHDYLAKIAHGFKASPAIFSAGSNYLLGGGGVQKGKRSQVVPRAITLLLNDQSTDLNECFYLKQRSKLKGWNHTGIYHHFAVVKGDLHIPEGYHPVQESGNWKLFAPYEDPSKKIIGDRLQIVTYQDKKVALIALFPNGDLNGLEKVIAANKDDKSLLHEFQFPEGDLIEYDLDAPKKKWVICRVNGSRVDRRHYHWKQIGLLIPSDQKIN